MYVFVWRTDVGISVFYQIQGLKNRYLLYSRHGSLAGGRYFNFITEGRGFKFYSKNVCVKNV